LWHFDCRHVVFVSRFFHTLSISVLRSSVAIELRIIVAHLLLHNLKQVLLIAALKMLKFALQIFLSQRSEILVILLILYCSLVNHYIPSTGALRTDGSIILNPRCFHIDIILLILFFELNLHQFIALNLSSIFLRLNLIQFWVCLEWILIRDDTRVLLVYLTIIL
jgi:hypothetical protein